jgi:hypothetical protein
VPEILCVPHPGCTAMDKFARGYAFVNAGSDVSRLHDGAIADVRAFRGVTDRTKRRSRSCANVRCQ